MEEFSAHKEEYVALLRRSCAKNAGFGGNSKQARAVGRAIGSEYDERVKQNAGTDRYGGMKATFAVGEGEDQTLSITYNVAGKRKAIVETYQFLTWEATKEAVLVALNDDADVKSDMDIATHYPEYFWLAKYHKQWPALVELTTSKRRG